MKDSSNHWWTHKNIAFHQIDNLIIIISILYLKYRGKSWQLFGTKANHALHWKSDIHANNYFVLLQCSEVLNRYSQTSIIRADSD